MSKYYRAVVYLESKVEINPVTRGECLEYLKCRLNDLEEDFIYNAIREFVETNEHKFNRAKDNEVKHV